MKRTSVLPKFYQLTPAARRKTLCEHQLLNITDEQQLAAGTLSLEQADCMVENVIGLFSLPVGLALNFLVNGKEYLVPMVVEEPSIVAAVSAAAKVARTGGGFQSAAERSYLIGQIQIVDPNEPTEAMETLLNHRERILARANSSEPRLLARGGGAKDLEIRWFPGASEFGDILSLHILVDTCDAMGANLVNRMCEELAPLIEELTGGRVFLRILSNLADRSLVRASLRIPTSALAYKGRTGEEVRDGIVLASDCAVADPYRAVTHNKGIMNGIDALALATGNDWRAIEAAAHAFAGQEHKYAPLATWSTAENGDLIGEITVPLKIGTVGAQVEGHPGVQLNLRMLAIDSAAELAELMAAVGLAQNFAALRALSTEGISRGHLRLHARTAAVAAGCPADLIDEVAEQLIRFDTVKVWKAREVVAELGSHKKGKSRYGEGKAPGKAILLGEHAVCYGSYALVTALPVATECQVQTSQQGQVIRIPELGVQTKLTASNASPLLAGLQHIVNELTLSKEKLLISFTGSLPWSAGLGSSAACFVAALRALQNAYDIDLAEEEFLTLVKNAESFVHEHPSGIDHSAAVQGGTLLFRNAAQPWTRQITAQPCWLVLGVRQKCKGTAQAVQAFRQQYRKSPDVVRQLIARISQLSLKGARALATGDLLVLAEQIRENQFLLCQAGLVAPSLESVVRQAEEAGALAAKLSGSGPDGSIIAVAASLTSARQIAEAIAGSCSQTLVFEMSGKTPLPKIAPTHLNSSDFEKTVHSLAV